MVKGRGSRVKSWKLVGALIALVAVQVGRLHAQGVCYIDPFTGERICGPAANAVTLPQLLALDSRLSALDSSAFCRITVGDGSAGSGTLVARTQSGGLVLTCSHLFDRSNANIEVAFSNGQRFAARIVDRDAAHDLAALVIRRPDAEPIGVGDDDALSRTASGALTACGFGPNGQFRCIRGEVVGQATPVGAVYPSLTIRGAVRPGDSGGGVLNAEGKLVGVIWGQRDGMSYLCSGRPLRELLNRVLGPPSSDREVVTHDNVETAPPKVADFEKWSREIEAKIQAIDAAKQSKGDYVLRSELPDFAKFAKREEVAGGLQSVSGRFESVLERVHSVQNRIEQVAEGGGPLHGLSTGKLLVGALGLSGPVAAAVVIAGGFVSWKVRRREKPVGDAREMSRPAQSKVVSRPIAVDSPPPPQRAVPETHYVSYESDSFSKAHQWACEQVARKYPGAAEILQAQESLIKQCLAGR
jgi:hypothetical protein